MSVDSGEIREGLFAAAAAGSLYTISLLFPAAMVSALFSPLPLAWLAWRTTAARAIFFALAAAVIPAFVAPTNGAAFLAQFGIGAVIIGQGIKARWEPHKIIGGYALISSASSFALLGIMAILASQTPTEFVASIAAELKEVMSGALSRQGTGTPPDAALAIEESIDEVVTFLLESFFGITVAMAIFTGWANATWLRRILTSRGEQLDSWLQWRAPENWIWPLIIGGSASLAGGTMAVVGLNVLIVSLTAYFLQGMAILQFFFVEKNISGFIRVPIYAMLIFYTPAAPVALATLGAFDMWMDFRNRISPPAETT